MTIGIIGYGHFGALLSELAVRFAPQAQVKVYSSRQAPDGKTFFSLEDAAACDIVIPCVPIHAFEEWVGKLLPLMREDAVLVDIATVKVHTVGILKKLAPERRWLATHPMWGPESYKKTGGDVKGFRIIITESTLSKEEKEQVISFLKQCGFDVVEMSSEQHDKHLAETLFLTHFIGQTVARGGFDRTEIDTVSFGYLMDAVEIVRHNTALFKDVYRFNPYCEEILKRFEAAEGEIHKLLGK